MRWRAVAEAGGARLLTPSSPPQATQGTLDCDAEVDRIRAEEARRREAAAASSSHELGPLDTTLRIKWLKSIHPSIDSAESVTTLLSVLLAPSPPDIDSIAVKPAKLSKDGKARKPKATDQGSAAVAFRTLRAAVRLMEKAEEGKKDKVWDGIEVSWAGGRPAVLGGAEAAPAARETPETAAPPPPSFASSFPTAVSFFSLHTSSCSPLTWPPFSAQMLVDSDEERILAQLRARERARLIAEMEKADADGV